MRRKTLAIGFVLSLSVSVLTSCATPEEDTSDASSSAVAGGVDGLLCPVLPEAEGWYGDNREMIQEAIDREGKCGETGNYDEDNRPFAVFDFDNTLVKNDISRALRYWMLANDKVKIPEGNDWRSRSPYLTEAATTALDDACRTAATDEGTLATSEDTRCADEIEAVGSGSTVAGEDAYAGVNHRTMNAGYVFGEAVLVGYTEEEIVSMVRQSRTEALDAPIGATQEIGSEEVPAYVRYYSEMKDLVQTLQGNGIDVFIMSASPEIVVKEWAPSIGVDEENAFGVKFEFDDDKLVSRTSSCGGSGEDEVIPYVDGKRCWINQEIVGIDGDAALEIAPDSSRHFLAAGDSSTDLTFLQDASEVRLAINANSPSLMCNAYFNEDGKWLVNPMFIDPMPKKDDPYFCSEADHDAGGEPAPARTESGTLIPIQEDSIY